MTPQSSSGTSSGSTLSKEPGRISLRKSSEAPSLKASPSAISLGNPLGHRETGARRTPGQRTRASHPPDSLGAGTNPMTKRCGSAEDILHANVEAIAVSSERGCFDGAAKFLARSSCRVAMSRRSAASRRSRSTSSERSSTGSGGPLAVIPSRPCWLRLAVQDSRCKRLTKPW